jgi:hypothetical protein
LRVDAVSAEKITESLDLIAQGREGCPLLLAGGFVTDQLLFPVAKHRRVLEVLGVDGAFPGRRFPRPAGAPPPQ